VLREDPSRAAHPDPTGQGRAQREAKGRSLAAADGDAPAVSWLLSSFHPLLADPNLVAWFPDVAARAAWADERRRNAAEKARSVQAFFLGRASVRMSGKGGEPIGCFLITHVISGRSSGLKGSIRGISPLDDWCLSPRITDQPR